MRPENEWFRPEHLARLRNVYLTIGAVLLGLPIVVGTGYVVLSVDELVPRVLAGGGGVGTVILIGVMYWYNRAFERSAAYRLTDEELQFRRGVWVKKESAVPYRRITNVTTSQGPIQRWVGAGSVGIHTAGHSGQMGPELTVQGIEDFEAVNEQIMAKVRTFPTAQDEGDDRNDARRRSGDGDLLTEVRRIRELLEE